MEVDSDQLQQVVRRAEQSLDKQDADLIRAVFESYEYVAELILGAIKAPTSGQHQR